jgi:hypothetical protein
MIVTTGHVKALEIAPEETAQLEVRVPLKDADRLPAPTFEDMQDGQPVVGSTR